MQFPVHAIRINVDYAFKCTFSCHPYILPIELLQVLLFPLPSVVPIKLNIVQMGTRLPNLTLP